MTCSARLRSSRAIKRLAGLLLAGILAAVTARAGLTYGWERKVAVQGLGNPLALNAQNPNTLYSGGLSGPEGSVLVSRDRGASWQTLAVLTGGANVKQVIVHPSDSLTLLVAQEAAPSDRIVKSTDGGATWSETFTGDFSYFGVPVAYEPDHPDTLYTMSGTALYRSADFGSHWTLVNAVTGFSAWCDAAVRTDSAEVMYVGDATAGIWKTTDAGLTFRQVYQTNGEIPMIAIDPANPAAAYATQYGGGGGLLRTTDYGESWHQVAEFAGINTWAVGFSRLQPEVVLMGVFEPGNAAVGAFLSLDAGASWRSITCGLTSNASYGVLALDSTSALLLQSDGLYALRTADTSALPRGALRGVVRDSSAPRSAEVRLQMRSCSWSMSLTQQTDSAGRFDFENLLPTVPPFVTGYDLDVDPEFPFAHLRLSGVHVDSGAVELEAVTRKASIFVAGADSADYMSYYRSAFDSLGMAYNAWNTAVRGPAPAERAAELAERTFVFFTGTQRTPLDSATSSHLAAALGAGVHLLLSGQDLVEENAATPLFHDVLGVAWQGNTASSFVRGTDLCSGFTFFTSAGEGAHNQTSRDVLAAPRGTTLLEYWDGMNAEPAALRFDSVAGGGRAVVAGFGLEAIDGDAKRAQVIGRIVGFLDGSVVEGAAGEGGFGELPRGVALEQNYPNPFNPSTRLRFSMREPGIADLTVYDQLGRTVAVVVHGYLPAGVHEQEWNAPGIAGGVYFAKLQVGSSRSVRRMLLVR